MINLIFAYILGGLTFIPLTILFTYCIYVLHGRIVLYAATETEDKLIENNNDEMATHSSSLYKVGWLKVSRNDGEGLQDATIGDMVINYISGLTSKKENANIYFSVLKYNTLYLYDSEKQLDSKGVINLSHFSIKMHPPGLQDYELFSKPNSIHLQSDKLNYYINCNKCIDKEDWYFSFIRASKFISPNSQHKQDNTRFHQSAMNHLIKMVYSDEHNFQTQWFNAILGRIFFGIYRTQDIKDALYKKVITKLDKINAKRPPFLGEITVRSADPGSSLPRFTQPKLLTLSPTGELTAEVMMQYDGGFRLEIETELKWQYSDHLKPLTIDLVLGITLKEIAGKLLVKIKEPPTNRLWYGFYECPKMEWKVEPLVWEKRVGYSVVVKAIETKIQEFIMETLVLPHFDDITFFPTNGVGGIFESNNSEDDTKKQQHRHKDEDLISTARSLPELFSSAVSSSSADTTKSAPLIDTSPPIPPAFDIPMTDDDSLLGSSPPSLIITPSTSSTLTCDNIQTTYSQDSYSSISSYEDKIKLRKSSSIALLKPKTGASTAINISPAIAHKSQYEKESIFTSM